MVRQAQIRGAQAAEAVGAPVSIPPGSEALLSEQPLQLQAFLLPHYWESYETGEMSTELSHSRLLIAFPSTI